MKLHEIYDKSKQLDEGKNDRFIFKAIFTSGGPASGKTTISRKLLSHLGFREVNIDRFIEFLASKNDLDLKDIANFDPIVFDRSENLSNKSMDLYIQGRLPLIIDGTGRNYQKITSLAERLKDLGYDVGLLFINTDLETTISRNQSRDRTIDLDYLKKAWQASQKNIGIFQDYFGSDMFIVDNNDSLNLEPVSRRINKFINTPVSNHKAKQWLDHQNMELTEERVDELFDTNANFRFVHDKNPRAIFEYDNQKYTVAFDDVGENIYEIVFGVPKTSSIYGKLNLTPTKSNRTDAVKIYSIVFNIIKTFIEEYEPDELIFNGSTTNGLNKLYAHMVKHSGSKLNDIGYKAEKITHGFRIDRLDETSSAGGTSAGSIAAVPGGLGVGFDPDGDYGIYPKPKKKNILIKR